MVDMAMHQILPAGLRYTRDLCAGLQTKQALGISSRAESDLIRRLSETTDALYEAICRLREIHAAVPTRSEEASMYYREAVIPAMEILRTHADTLEELTDKSYWPYPTYSDLLFY